MSHDEAGRDFVLYADGTIGPRTATHLRLGVVGARKLRPGWSAHEDIDMAYQGDVEIIHNWREEHSIEDLQRIVERKGYSALRAQSRAHGQNVRGSGFYFPASGPEGIYVSLRQGDILLFNPSAPHCATEPWYESDDPGWFRVRSLVSCYLNRDMIGAARAAQKIAPG